jgi:TetR/AcrR family fatty acid metabolism transcriptional regulator
VADGTIYLYVDNKEDLLFQLFEEKMSLLVAQAEAALAEEPDAPARLRRFIQLHFQLVERNPEITKVLIVELRQSKLMLGLKKQRLAVYLELVADVVREGQASGQFHAEVSPATMKRAIFGALDEIALGWLQASRKTPLRRAGEEIATLFVRGLLARSGSGPQSPSKPKGRKAPRRVATREKPPIEKGEVP